MVFLCKILLFKILVIGTILLFYLFWVNGLIAALTDNFLPLVARQGKNVDRPPAYPHGGAARNKQEIVSSMTHEFFTMATSRYEGCDICELLMLFCLPSLNLRKKYALLLRLQ